MRSSRDTDRQRSCKARALPPASPPSALHFPATCASLDALLDFQEATMKIRLLLAAVVLSIASLLSGCGYNTMQANEEAVKKAWGDVEATYQRRADLIPNLVTVVKAYAKHERETLTAVTEARAKVGQVKLSADKLDDPAAVAQFQ